MRTAFLRCGLVVGGLGLLVVAGPAAAQQTIRYGFGTGTVPSALEVSLTLPMHQSIGWYKEEGITFKGISEFDPNTVRNDAVDFPRSARV